MKTIITLLISFQLLAIASIAQIPQGKQLKWSVEQKGLFNEYWGSNNNYIVMAQTYKKKYKSPVVINSKNYSAVKYLHAKKIKINNKDYSFKTGKVFQNKLFAIVFQSIKTFTKNPNRKSYLVQYSLPNLTIEKKWKLDIHYDAYSKQSNSTFYDRDSKNYKPFAQILVSPNGEHLRIFGFEDKKSCKYNIYSFNSNLEMTESSVSMENMTQKYLIQDDLQIDNNGDIFMLFHYNPKKSKKKKNDDDESEDLTGVINVLTGDIWEWDYEEYYVINKKMVLKDNDIIIAGLGYGNESFSVFKTKFIKTKGFTDNTYTTFDLSNVLEYESEATIALIKKDISNLKLLRYSCDNIDFTDDGKMIIYGEYNSLTLVTGDVYSIQHFFEDIWVAFIDTDNSLLSFKVIPKRQFVQLPGWTDFPYWLSYLPICDGSDMYFIFQDHPANLTRDMHKKVYQTKNRSANTSICKVTSEGEVTRKQWNDNGKTKVFPNPIAVFRNSDGDIVIPASTRSKTRFAVINNN